MAAKSRKFCILLLRLLAFGATLSAAVVMVTSHQKIDFFTIHLEAKYSDTPAFKYFVYANAIGSVHGFIVLFVPPASMLGQLVQALDVVITILLTSGISTALAIAYVGKKGNSSAGWRPICGQVPRYCDHVTGALTAGFIGLLIYVAFVVSSFRTIFKPLLAQKA